MDKGHEEEGLRWLERKFRGLKLTKWTWGHADFQVIGKGGKPLHLIQMKYSARLGGTIGRVGVKDLVGLLDEAHDHRAKAWLLFGERQRFDLVSAKVYFNDEFKEDYSLYYHAKAELSEKEYQDFKKRCGWS
jgi:hypothetical protein